MPTIYYVSAEEYAALRLEVHELYAMMKELSSLIADINIPTIVYSVKTLAVRLTISERSAYNLIRQGQIGYFCAGAKNYRVSERAVRRFEDGLPPK